MSVRTAVVGAGIMGDVHLKQLNTIQDIDVVALMDPNEENATTLSTKHDVEGVFGDMETMLAVARPEYVIVASPPRFHAAQAIAAMQSGAHVLVEKPLCITVSEAEAIEACAKQTRRQFTMGVQRRQSRAMRAVKQFIQDGELGTVYHSRVWAGHIMSYAWGQYHHRKEMSLGGVLAATTVHTLDACLWLIGAPEPLTVTASTFRRLDKMKSPHVSFEGTATDSTVEDFGHAHVRFADGSSMSIEGNWLMHPTKHGNGFEILGVNGVARDVAPYVELEEGTKVIPYEFNHEEEPDDAVRQEHVEFIDAIRGNGIPIVSFQEALTVQKILVGIYTSAESGKEVSVKDLA